MVHDSPRPVPTLRRLVPLTVAVLAVGVGALAWPRSGEDPQPSASAVRAAAEAPSDDGPPGAPVAEVGRAGVPDGALVIGPSVGSGAALPRTSGSVTSHAGHAWHAAHGSTAASTSSGGLHPGDMAFWDGGFVEAGNVRSADLCGVAGPCFEFPLVLQAGGARLRVAIDTPSREDTFKIEVIGPDGAVVASTTNGNQFNAEAFAAEPAVGPYVVRVLPQAVERAAFRMRAKLEEVVPAGPAGRVAMLPNLQVVPPYEFGFAAPVTPNGSYPPDAANPPASAAGKTLYSCTQDESAPVEAGGAGAVDCLRLTSGPMNVGAGPFDMRFTFVADLADGTANPAYLRGPILQAVHYSDGSEELRDAGTYIWHTTHAHFHDENILTYEGFKVTDRVAGRLVRIGAGTKSGFCPADQLFGRWFEFTQAVRGDFGEGDTPTGNCFDAQNGLLGLTSGWGDVYRWQRPGQYIEFAGQSDGYYVIRSTVDAANAILETDEDDNTSYAYIKVVDRTVHLLERGQGTDPWDPDKLVFSGDGPASVR